MARADLLIKLIRAGSQGDQASFRRAVEALIAEERAKHHFILADRLAANLKSNGDIQLGGPTPEKSHQLFLEAIPQRSLTDLVLTAETNRACSELVEEHQRAELLRAHGLEPRHRVLLAGPPGNGKTSLAEAIAYGLSLPLLTIRYEALIGSFLGETGGRLRRVFDFVRTYPCVLFFDEFETIGKERGDTHETGEVKRIVSSLLLQMDALPSYVVVITASNHPELLDRAVWRRFQLRLTLPPPGKKQIEEWFKRFENTLGVSLGYSHRTLSEELCGITFAEAEDFCTDVLRRYILSHKQAKVQKIVSSCVQQWRSRFSP